MMISAQYNLPLSSVTYIPLDNDVIMLALFSFLSYRLAPHRVVLVVSCLSVNFAPLASL